MKSNDVPYAPMFVIRNKITFVSSEQRSTFVPPLRQTELKTKIGRHCFGVCVNQFSLYNLIDRCWSLIGRVGGEQKLSLGRGCEQTGTAIHEILHALGVWHEQVGSL